MTTKKEIPSPRVESSNDDEDEEIDIMQIVNAINESGEYDTIEEKILNKSNQLNRILLVFYFVNKIFGNNASITTGDVQKVTDQLGVKIKSSNVAGKMKDNSKYFSADTVRKKGAIVNYKLNKKGLDYFSELLTK